MKTLLFVAWIAFAPQQERSATTYDVPLAELALAKGAELPAYPDQAPYEKWDLFAAMWPYAVIEGEGEAVYTLPGYSPHEWQRPGHGAGRLLVRTDSARDVRGLLFVPRNDWNGMMRFEFTIPAARATSDEAAFLRAQAQHYARLLNDRVAGAAWFRHRLDEIRKRLSDPPVSGNEPAVAQWENPTTDDDLLETYGLFSGGRALAENLQLERAIPTAAPDDSSVALSSIEGITVREFKWESRLGGTTALDPLADLVPADQHALFFPSFQAMVDVLDEASELGVFALSAFEAQSADARTRERYERQLCLEVDAFARTLGGMAIESVAFTGSDPYLRTGSDVALLFRAKSREALRAFIASRQDVAGPTEGARKVEGEIDGLSYRGVVNETHTVSSYLAEVSGVLVVANSLEQLRRIARVSTGELAALAKAGEYRFFRQRYPLGAAKQGGEAAFLILPDAAIRRWCGPKWRIAASRRTRAAAVLAELDAEHAEELLRGVSRPVALVFDSQGFDLGELRLTPDGAWSSIYGSLSFQTPIAELEIETVSSNEAAFYQRWRDGYQQNWSGYFDPIALSISVEPDRLAADLTVMPLILGTDYAEMRTFVGDEALDPDDGDRHEDSIFHFALALDPKTEPIQEIGREISGIITQLTDPMGWIGGFVEVYADADVFWEDLFELQDSQAAFEELAGNPNEIPLVVSFGVGSAVKLAAFISTLRGFVESSAPGLLNWNNVEDGEHRFVEIRAMTGMTDDFSVFYATTPEAFVITLKKEALLRALDRLARRSSGKTQAPGSSPQQSWIGESVSLEVERQGLNVFGLLFGESWTSSLRDRSWANFPILHEWKRLYPDRDPLAVHERVFGERLRCPAGGEYVWNDAWKTMESTVYGSPAEPRSDLELPSLWKEILKARFGLTFEEDGLRARAEVERE